MSEHLEGDPQKTLTPKLSFDGPVRGTRPSLVILNEIDDDSDETELNNEHHAMTSNETTNNFVSPTNLDGLTVDDLRKQEEAIQKAILEKQASERKAVIEQIVQVVNTYKIPIEELVDALGGIKIKRKGVKAQIKYQDPIPWAAWFGRGKEPSLIKDKDRSLFQVTS